MESVRQSCRPKHQVLVLKCYPQYQKGVQDVKPNSSELSYLLYYVSTRRSKLTKVGAFLEKRAARDVWRNKIGNVQVTLQILSALIEKVPRDLPIYARSVMTILETVLRSHDIALVEESISTFETFCRHQDMAALSAEQDFANQYREVVRTYADFADNSRLSVTLNSAPSGPLETRWKTAGLRAVKGVVSSEAALAADGGDSLRLILPVILDNLYTGDDHLLVSLELKLHEPEKQEPSLSRRRRISNATIQTVDAVDGDPALAAQSAADVDRQAEMDMRLLALRCLERIIVTGSSRGQIRVTTKAVFQFVLSKSTSEPNNHTEAIDSWATSLVELIAKWCPVQIRFTILVAVMELLLEAKPTEQTLDRSHHLIYMIDWLLKSPVNMIGLSVIDVLLGLMQFMSSLLSPLASEKTADGAVAEKWNDQSGNDIVLSSKRLEVLALLQKTIGDLTTHIYYGDQVIDMIRTILTRIKPANNELSSDVGVAVQENFEGNINGAGFPGETNTEAFSLPIAKITALKAIQNIITVANSQRHTSTGVETRNPVGIHVWEGTQPLLRESNKEVRYAYVNAFLAWLRLETTHDDLKAKEVTARMMAVLPRRESPDLIETSGRRPANVSLRGKAIVVAQLNFLRLFHLTLYDMALESPTNESEVLMIYLLLTTLVDHLGINAVRFGLPMVLRLQDDLESEQNLQPALAKVNIASLVYGYLWTIVEKFQLEKCRVGNEIQAEIENRQRNGLWLVKIHLPAAHSDNIMQIGENPALNGQSIDQNQLTPFKSDMDELVYRIEMAYNSSVTSPSHSPPGSPGRNLAIPNLTHGSTAVNPPKPNLPSSIKEQMLLPWTRESCLAAAEKEKVEAMSLSGSRAGTLAFRNYAYANGAGNSSHSTAASIQQSAFGAAAGLQRLRRTSVPEQPGSPVNGSSRESPVRVNELRRVLSVNTASSGRRLSPLRGRLDASNGSIMSSSSESMVSGISLSEFDADGNSIRPLSTRDGQMTPNGDGMDTPRASNTALNGGPSQQSLQSNAIPPVPPLPPSISLLGGFPNDSGSSLPNGDRPSTAPGPRQIFANGKPEKPAPGTDRTLARHKSRSSTGLAAAAAASGRKQFVDEVPEGADPSEIALRRDVQNLINGFLSPMDAELRNSSSTLPRTRTGQAGRRRATGGIGRPPY